MPISSGCQAISQTFFEPDGHGFAFSFGGIKGFNGWGRAVEDRDGVAAGFGDAIHICHFGAEQFIGLHADLVRGAVVDAQCFRAATHIHAQRLPGEGLLEDALTQVPGEEQAVGTVASQRCQQFQLRNVDILGFVHHDEIKGCTLAGCIMRQPVG